tara:strand:- start:556 stop:906 length:351 start_codon:yes stop_codon:yes gene_type:complete
MMMAVAMVAVAMVLLVAVRRELRRHRRHRHRRHHHTQLRLKLKLKLQLQRRWNSLAATVHARHLQRVQRKIGRGSTAKCGKRRLRRMGIGLHLFLSLACGAVSRGAWVTTHEQWPR